MSRSPYLHALELLAAARASRAAEPECSVTISRNAKQDIQFEVVVRGPSVTDCNLLAQYEADLLAVKYPAEGSVSPQDAPEPSVKEKAALATASLAAPATAPNSATRRMRGAARSQ